MCPRPQLLVGPAQQGANLVYPQSGPAFPSCPSGAKWLLPAEACVPACKEDILAGMLPASVQHISADEQVYWPVSPCQLLVPVPCSRGSPGALPSSGSCCGGTGRWGRRQHGNTSSNRRGCFQHLQRAFYCCGLPASRRQLGYFPSVSNAVPAVCLCQTCSDVPLCGDLLWVSLGRAAIGHGWHQLM